MVQRARRNSMADISQCQIARLVLGYLKEESKSAYKYFLHNSPHLEKFRSKNYAICTRLNGFTLQDILSQYSELNLILHAKLESTDYFEHNPRQNADLPQQLVYILNTKTENHSSGETTPFSDCQHTFDDSNDVASVSVSSTPLKSLPGTTSSVQRKEIKLLVKRPTLECSVEQRNQFAEVNAVKSCFSGGVSSVKHSMNACGGFQEQIAKTFRLADETKTVFNQSADAVEIAVKSFASKATHNDSIFDKVLNELLDLGPSQSHKEETISPAMVTITPLVPYEPNDKKLISIEDPHTGEETGYIVDINLSEHDIMSLPVILDDDRKIVVEQVGEKRVKTLLPVKNNSESNEMDVVEDEENPAHFITPDTDEQTANETTPRGSSRSSHIRALDFKFQTPGKSPKTSKPHAKSVKSLFNDENSDEKKAPWDLNFRKVLNQDPSISSPFTLPKTSSAAHEAIETNLAKNSTKKYSKKSAKETTPVAKEEVLQFHTATKILNLRHIGVKPNYKRKCNVDTKDTGCPKIIEVKRVLSVPCEPDKTVQSPSTLNGNRRALVNDNNGPALNMPTITMTPEKPQPAEIILLETPCKDCPKTPSIFSPANAALETPFTKAINEHLSNIDILSIETPKLPLTPNFAITPLLNSRETACGSSTRPTDYSTSSSYYQPSDSEQNRSLEQFIKEECKRSDVKNTTPPQAETEFEVPDAAIASKLNDLAKNVIARKNLHLVSSNKNTSTLESSSSSSSDSSTSSSDGECSDNDEKREPEVVQNVDNLKTQTSSANVIPDSKKQFLNDLEEKRKRTIAMMKQGDVKKSSLVTRMNTRKRSLRSHNVKADSHLSSDDEENVTKSVSKESSVAEVVKTIKEEAGEKEKKNAKRERSSKSAVPIKKRAVSTKKPIKIKISPKKKVLKSAQSKPIQKQQKSSLKPSPSKHKTDKVKKSLKKIEKPVCVQEKASKTKSGDSIVKQNGISGDMNVIVNDKVEKITETIKCEKRNETKESEVKVTQTDGHSEDEMLLDLKERQIHLMRMTKLQNTKETNNLQTEDCSERIETFDNKCVVVDNTNRLGRCEEMCNTHEDQLVTFDVVHSFAEIHCVYTHLDKDEVDGKTRDYDDDQKRMMKEFGATVYDECNGVEIEKTMSITPFQLLLDIPPQFAKETTNNDKVKILNNILIQKIPKKTISDCSALSLNAKDCTKSPLDNLYKSESQLNLNANTKRGNSCIRSGKLAKKSNEIGHSDSNTNAKKEKKRKVDANPSTENNDGKKIKLCQELLKNINVDNVLDKLYE